MCDWLTRYLGSLTVCGTGLLEERLRGCTQSTQCDCARAVTEDDDKSETVSCVYHEQDGCTRTRWPGWRPTRTQDRTHDIDAAPQERVGDHCRCQDNVSFARFLCCAAVVGVCAIFLSDNAGPKPPCHFMCGAIHLPAEFVPLEHPHSCAHSCIDVLVVFHVGSHDGDNEDLRVLRRCPRRGCCPWHRHALTNTSSSISSPSCAVQYFVIETTHIQSSS